jgi:2-methylcitrate dehydratase PrpD
VSTGAFSHSSDTENYFQVNEESADHSLRYSCSVACLDQEVTTAQYRNERYTDPDVVEFSKHLNFHVDESYDRYLRPGRVRIQLRNGETLENETLYPPGDIENEISFDQLREKFERAWEYKYPNSDPSTTIQTIENIEKVDNIEQLIDQL